MEPYYAAAVQSSAIAGYAEPQAIAKNLKHCLELIDRVVDGTAQTTKGQSPKIIAFPEAFLHGFGPARKRTFDTNYKMARPIPGEETDRLAEKAREYDTYISGTTFEIDPNYPNHYFNTGFIIDPKGRVVLKYRKLNGSNNNIGLDTSPGDVLARYGTSIDDLFPVLRTPLGNIGMFICYDGFFPEVSRCLALNGAEVLLRPMGPIPTGGTYSLVENWRYINRTRAFENNAYLIAPHWADSPQSESMVSEGHSMILDYNGNILVESEGAREHFVIAQIDIDRLRHRRQGERNTFLVQLRSEIYAQVLAARPCWPSGPDQMMERGFRNQDEKWEFTRQTYDRLVRMGVLTPP